MVVGSPSFTNLSGCVVMLGSLSLQFTSAQTPSLSLSPLPAQGGRGSGTVAAGVDDIIDGNRSPSLLAVRAV